jgi:TetR/AcrR family transcriptional regulator, mexCD-oprJ operon repressor
MPGACYLAQVRTSWLSEGGVDVAGESARDLAVDEVADLGADRPKRADARRNIEAILEAATSCLAADPACSVGEIAAAAKVGRVTLYGHFQSRTALVDAVVTRAMADTDAALEAVDITGDPREALARLIEATWQLTDRFGALVVAAEHVLSPERMHEVHAGPMQRVNGLIARGQAEGAFRNDLPKDWLVATLHGLIHAAANAIATEQLSTEQAPNFINAIVQSAFTAHESVG